MRVESTALYIRAGDSEFVYINGKPIAQNRVEIKNNDVATFGTADANEYEFKQIQLNVCASMITSDDKRKLKKQLTEIGETFLDEWSKECTHLIMSSVQVTN